ncbi:hypothetical protein MKW98_023804, partial [Papaver atlanticum]
WFNPRIYWAVDLRIVSPDTSDSKVEVFCNTLQHHWKNEQSWSSIVENFNHLVNVARVSDPPVRNSQEAFMMEMRGARMVQAADSLLKLVSELKQTAIFSGLASLNEHVEQQTAEFDQQAEKTEQMLSRIGEEAAGCLKELESHYYSSAQRIDQGEQ